MNRDKRLKKNEERSVGWVERKKRSIRREMSKTVYWETSTLLNNKESLIVQHRKETNSDVLL